MQITHDLFAIVKLLLLTTTGGVYFQGRYGQTIRLTLVRVTGLDLGLRLGLGLG